MTSSDGHSDQGSSDHGKSPTTGASVRCGFTLLEVIIVVLLMGIVAAVAQPRFSGALTMYRADAAAERLASDLRYAATMARVTGKSVTIQFVTGTHGAASYYRFDQHADPNVPGRRMLPNDSATWYTVVLSDEPYRAALTSAPASLAFDIYGLSGSDADFRITVGSEQRTVSVLRSSPGVSIE